MQTPDDKNETCLKAVHDFEKNGKQSCFKSLLCGVMLLVMSVVSGLSVWKWQLAEQHTLQTQRNLLRTLSQLGDSFLESNQSLKTLDAYQQAFNLSKKLLDEHPENTLVQRDLSVSLERMGNVYSQLNQTGTALYFYQECLKIRSPLATQAPDDADVQRDLFVSFTNLGNIYHKRKQTQLALLAFQRALQIAEKRAQDKNNALAQEDLMWVRTRLTELHD